MGIPGRERAVTSLARIFSMFGNRLEFLLHSSQERLSLPITGGEA